MIGKHSNIASTGSDISANVTIGNYTNIGPHVQMHTLHNHACVQDRNLVSTAQLKGYPHPNGAEKMTIGSDVWIGRNAVLLGNITIGHGAIIGAFSVVAGDVLPYSVVVGNPAKVIRMRFKPEQIEALLEIRWWDWSDERVEENKENLLNIESFINKLNN